MEILAIVVDRSSGALGKSAADTSAAPPRPVRSMAQTEHLPIYKAGYDLCLYLEQTVVKFARTHRYALGAELREGAVAALRRPRSRLARLPLG